MALHRTITENPVIKYKLLLSTHISTYKNSNRALTEISANLKDQIIQNKLTDYNQLIKDDQKILISLEMKTFLRYL